MRSDGDVHADADRCDVRAIHPERVARVRALLLPDERCADLAELFRALGDSSRAKIVFSLLQQELCVCDLAAVVSLSESAVSQHLRILRALRLVRNRREGKVVYYSLDDHHIATLLRVCQEHLQDQRLDGEEPGATTRAARPVGPGRRRARRIIKPPTAAG